MLKENIYSGMTPKMESAASEYATSLMDCVYEEIVYPIEYHETNMGFEDLECEFNCYLESMTSSLDPYWIVEHNLSEDDQIICYNLEDEGYEVMDNICDMVEDYVEKHKDEYILDLKEWYVDFSAKWCLSSPNTLEHLEIEKEECGAGFDLDYSVGNCIYIHCGDGSDDLVKTWVDSHKSEIREKFASLVG